VATENEYQPGDRVSFFGGEGVVVKTEGELIHILTEEERKIIEQRSNLPLVSRTKKFKSGEQVTFPGGKGEIIKVEERREKANLLYINPEEGELKTLPADQKGLEPLEGVADRIKAGRFSEPQRFNLLTQATQLNLAHRFDRFLSLTGNRIDVTPHQIEAVHEILTSHDHRYIIADEVGLGKTIEAGLVIEELIARDRADRVLIVTPASLTAQWKAEMAEKFDQD
jgi:SNF2 family DNA or RNA helicase